MKIYNFTIVIPSKIDWKRNVPFQFRLSIAFALKCTQNQTPIKFCELKNLGKLAFRGKSTSVKNMAALFVYDVSLVVNQVPPHIDQAGFAVPASVWFNVLLDNSTSIRVVSYHFAADIFDSEFYSLQVIHPRETSLNTLQVKLI